MEELASLKDECDGCADKAALEQLSKSMKLRKQPLLDLQAAAKASAKDLEKVCHLLLHHSLLREQRLEVSLAKVLDLSLSYLSYLTRKVSVVLRMNLRQSPLEGDSRGGRPKEEGQDEEGGQQQCCWQGWREERSAQRETGCLISQTFEPSLGACHVGFISPEARLSFVECGLITRG